MAARAAGPGNAGARVSRLTRFRRHGLNRDRVRALTAGQTTGIVLLGAATTRWRLSLVKLLPLRAHFMTDVLIGIVAIAAPFVLGFSDETAALVWFLVVGAGELLAAFGTAWEPADERPGERPRPARTEPLSG